LPVIAQQVFIGGVFALTEMDIFATGLQIDVYCQVLCFTKSGFVVRSKGG
jgi:hypothetical protein